MNNEKTNFKLVNMALLCVIIYLIYKTGNLWLGIIGKAWQILFPFLIAFILAYALYPFTLFLRRHKFPKKLSNFIALALVVGLIAFIGIIVFPILTNELSSLFGGIITFIKEISLDYDLDLGPLQNSLSSAFKDIIGSVGKNVSNGAISFINGSLSVLSTALIAFSASVYFLFDMDAIRKRIKTVLRKKSKRTFTYFKKVDNEMKNYLSGFIRIAFISLFEYGIAYAIIGHPSAFLLAILASVANLIPYFGGIVNNTIAAITAFAISPSLFVKTLIAFAVLSGLDGYVINPLVYGKTNQVHPILVISAVFAGGILGGILGIIISLPVAIVLITTYKFYKEDIYEKIDSIKESKKEEV
ncbi:MAG: AI-2E family transporter [Bacilli bacterium]|nr:AI-2E family transporter [Bacilli bacterium]